MNATDFSITPAQADDIRGALILPADMRLLTLQQYAAAHGHDATLALCAQLFGLANAVTENCREQAAHLLTLEGMHPHTAEKINMPTLLGALMGICLAAKAPKQDSTCAGCAYRLGTVANQCPSTVDEAAWQLQDLDRFSCHESEDLPPCRGHAQALKTERIEIREAS